MITAFRMALRSTVGNLFRMTRNFTMKVGDKQAGLIAAGASERSAQGKVARIAGRWQAIGEDLADIAFVGTGIAGGLWAFGLLQEAVTGTKKVVSTAIDSTDEIGASFERYAFISLICGAGLIALYISTRRK